MSPHSDEIDRLARMRLECNPFRIWTLIDGEWVSHYRAREFRSRATGLVLVHPTLTKGLELVHRDLTEIYQETMEILVTNGGRMPLDIKRLVEKWGWVDEGGRVSRDSKHNIETWPGIASDIVGRRQGNNTEEGRVLLATMEEVCGRYFDKVIIYPNVRWERAHAHVDQRAGGLRL